MSRATAGWPNQFVVLGRSRTACSSQGSLPDVRRNSGTAARGAPNIAFSATSPPESRRLIQNGRCTHPRDIEIGARRHRRPETVKHSQLSRLRRAEGDLLTRVAQASSGLCLGADHSHAQHGRRSPSRAANGSTSVARDSIRRPHPARMASSAGPDFATAVRGDFVATDIAARGRTSRSSQVINYDLPPASRGLHHRIGSRTGPRGRPRAPPHADGR